MTRYARATGSKASNARDPEEATPWSQMRAEMTVEKTKKTDAIKEQKEAKAKAAVSVVPGRKEKMRNPEDEDDDIADVYQDEPIADTAVADFEDSGNEEEDGDDGDGDENAEPGRLLDADELRREAKKKKKNQRIKEKCKQCKVVGHWKKDCPQLSEERRKELTELEQMKRDRKGKGTGRKKNKRKDKEQGEENGTATANGNTNTPMQGKNNKSKNDNKRSHQQRPAVPKREVKDLAGVVVADGEGLYQGFRVQQKDVPRLKELEKKLKGEGLKKDDLYEAMKKERRRAEKDLQRLKKNVCFHCRQPGHMLADCPETDLKKSGGGASSSMANSMCFKCGASDHTSKSCTNSKRKGEDAYAFATCFICKEKGHLAKACPDNPKGLYPRGGGCRFCGSVEHLKSECPRKKEKDDRDELRVGTLATTTTLGSGGGGVEEMEPRLMTEGRRKRQAEGEMRAAQEGNKKSKKKAVVMF